MLRVRRHWQSVMTARSAAGRYSALEPERDSSPEPRRDLVLGESDLALFTGTRKRLVTGTPKRPGTLEKWLVTLHWNLKVTCYRSPEETQHSRKWPISVIGKWPGTPEKKTLKEKCRDALHWKKPRRQSLTVKATSRPWPWPLCTAVERASSCRDGGDILLMKYNYFWGRRQREERQRVLHWNRYRTAVVRGVWS